MDTIIGESRIVIIDRTRTQRFDPVKLLGRRWAIKEQDKRSLSLVQVDLANVQLEHMLKKDENSIKGEERLKRLKLANHICLDAKIFQTLWRNWHFIPEQWKEKTNGKTTHVFFDGTVLRSPGGDRCVLYLCWRGGLWVWGCHWPGDDWGISDPSAVLASI